MRIMRLRRSEVQSMKAGPSCIDIRATGYSMGPSTRSICNISCTWQFTSSGLTPGRGYLRRPHWNPACSLRLSQATGSLEPGKSADLLIMEAGDYRDLPRRAGHHDVSLVMRRGRTILRSPALSVD